MTAAGLRYEYSVVDFSKTLEASFIGSANELDERYSPKILCNNQETSENVLTTLQREFADCVSFDISVAFITESGMQVLAKTLSELRQRGVQGRILTSTYLSFNQPDALRKLLEYSNIEARIYQGDLHAKGYFFDKDGISTVIIGSSNLTQRALTCNKEWNVLFRSFPKGGILNETRDAFEVLWNDELSIPLSDTWITQYEAFLAEHPRSVPTRKMPGSVVNPIMPDGSTAKIKPNKMQESALEALDVLHRRSEERALLISATGTGKTYLSALDIDRTKPKRVLFIAHRQRILSASAISYQKVLGDRYSYGFLADARSHNASCLFAMVIQLAGSLEQFSPDEFDYIVIDEAHRTGAASYQKILEYFKPKFFLGMTATPSRTDGYDVYSLFNHVIAYRITLQDALENDMLVPFHYFGVADLSIDEESIDDVTLFSKLTSQERARHVIDKIEEYSVRKTDRKGLIFCSRNDEARKLSELFNQQGYKTIAISGDTPESTRDDAIARLERGELQYIFSVDILNEGIDIPSLNQIIMLRKTDSAIVFVQQLGRGLRKDPTKDYTLVLDFIGNYQRNYLIPIALADDRTYNKDNLRKIVKEGSSYIPGCSTISFDRIAEKRIFKALEEEKFGSVSLIRAEYDDLRRLLGRIPKPCEFDSNGSIDPLIIMNKFGSYAAFLMKYEDDCPFSFGEAKLAVLKFISTKLASGKRLGELIVLDALIKGKRDNCPASLPLPQNNEQAKSVMNMLTGTFSKAGQELVRYSNGEWNLSPVFDSMLNDTAFADSVTDTLEFALSRNQKLYSSLYKDTDFVLNQKYTYEDVCRLLRWSKEPNYQNIGGYFHDKETNTFPVFINYEKDPDISVTTQYHDRFISERKIICISKSKRTMESPEIVKLRNIASNGMRCFLFLRKDKKDKETGKEFYFLGEMHPSGEFEQTTAADDKTSIVEIGYNLERPVRADLYDYFTSSLEG